MKENRFLLGALAGLLCVMNNADGSFNDMNSQVEVTTPQYDYNANPLQAYRSFESKIAQSQETLEDIKEFLKWTIERSKLKKPEDELCTDMVYCTYRIEPGHFWGITLSRAFGLATRSFVLVGFDHCGYDREPVAKMIDDILNSNCRLVGVEDEMYEEICKAWLAVEKSGSAGIKSNELLETRLQELKATVQLFAHAGKSKGAKLRSTRREQKVFQILSDIYSAWGTRTPLLEKSLPYMTMELRGSLGFQSEQEELNYYLDSSIADRGLNGARQLWEQRQEEWAKNKHIYVQTLRTLLKAYGWNEEENTFKGKPIEPGDMIKKYIDLLKQAERL